MGPIDISEIVKPIWEPDPSLLLHPNIPSGAHGLNPRSVLGKEWWDATRKGAELANNYCCYACSTHKSSTIHHWLEGHEVYDIDYDKKIMTYIRTVSLCNKCHSFIHSGLLLANLFTRKVRPVRYARIVSHGVNLLTAATPPMYPSSTQILQMEMAVSGKLIGTAYTTVRKLLKELPKEVRDRAHSFAGRTLEEHELLTTHIPIRTWSLIVGENKYTHEDILKTV